MSKQQLIEEVFGVDANLYVDALCIDQYASEKEIEKAYLRQWQIARKELTLHDEDKQELVQKKLEALLLAYRILSNSELRKRYDDMLTEVSLKKKLESNAHLHTNEFIDDRQSSFSSRGSGDNSERISDDSTSFNSSLSYGAKTRRVKTKTRQDAPSSENHRNNGQQKNSKNNTPDNSNHIKNTAPDSKASSFLSNGNGSDNFIFDKKSLEEKDRGDDSFAENSSRMGLNSSLDSESTFTVNFDSKKMAANVSNITIQEDDAEEDNESNSFRTEDASIISDEKIRSVTSQDQQLLEACSDVKESLKKKSSSKVVTFKDEVSRQSGASTPTALSFDGDDSSTLLEDDGTVGDSTIDTVGESTVGTLDDYYEEDYEKGRTLATEECYEFLPCTALTKHTQVNKILQNITDEVKGSFDDTISAMDQVFNAFTIQPDEFSSLVTKIETEKQTLGFSSRFINMAQAEREKRLSASKQSSKERNRDSVSSNREPYYKRRNR